VTPGRRLGAAARSAAALALALAAAGCGESRDLAESTDTEPRREPPPPLATAALDVSEREFRLSPGGARLDRPASVEIDVTNRGRRPHALAVESPVGERRTRTLRPRESARLTVALDRPGRYRWWCPVGDHRERGMRGTIGVARPR
jgi:plastocyanin